MPNYAPIPGFDINKINDPAHVNDKYSPALRAFSEAMAAGIPLTRGNLAPQVDFAKSHGFANAKQVGDDSVDYGDTRGPIDLIRGGDDATMFLDKAVWGQPAPPVSPTPPPALGTSPTQNGITDPSVRSADSTQSDLVRQALLQLGGGAQTGSAPPASPVDPLLGNYDDQLRQQIMAQL